MLKVFIQKSVLMLITLLITSCSTYRIAKISILMPGQVEFPSDVRSLSLVLLKNEFNMPKGRLDSINNIRLDPEFNYYQFAMEYLYGLQHTIEESPRVEKVVITDLNNLDSLGYQSIFDWREIIRICRKDSTDALIMIEDFVLEDSLKVTDLFGGYFLKYELKNRMNYFILNPKRQDITGKYYVTNENLWHGEDLSFENAAEQLPDPSDMILQSCYETGQKAGRCIAPVWKDNIRRVYYIRGNKLIAKGASYAKSDMWKEAAQYWRMAADSRKDRISAKAAFNMALICEIEDKLELAHNWIALSDSLRSSEFSLLYQQILHTRLEYQKELDRQLGFEE